MCVTETISSSRSNLQTCIYTVWAPVLPEIPVINQWWQWTASVAGASTVLFEFPSQGALYKCWLLEFALLSIWVFSERSLTAHRELLTVGPWRSKYQHRQPHIQTFIGNPGDSVGGNNWKQLFMKVSLFTGVCYSLMYCFVRLFHIYHLHILVCIQIMWSDY